jgi:hypothetical protein
VNLNELRRSQWKFGFNGLYKRFKSRHSPVGLEDPIDQPCCKRRISPCQHAHAFATSRSQRSLHSWVMRKSCQPLKNRNLQLVDFIATQSWTIHDIERTTESRRSQVFTLFFEAILRRLKEFLSLLPLPDGFTSIHGWNVTRNQVQILNDSLRHLIGITLLNSIGEEFG